MAVASVISNPFSLIILQRLTIAFIVAFVPKSSPLRPLIFSVFIAWNIHLLPRYYETIPRASWVAYVSGEALGATLAFMEKVLIKRWSFDTDTLALFSSTNGVKAEAKTHVPEKKETLDADDLKATIWTRVRFGLYISFSARYIASSHQAPHTPPYSLSRPTYIPSRSKFLLQKGIIITIAYLINDILVLGNQPDQNPTLYGASQILFFSRLWHRTLTIEDFSVRVTTSLGFWFGAYWALQGYFCSLSLLTVLFGVSRPQLERPVLGNVIEESYTLRGFWSRGWHQMLRRILVAGADWLIYGLLGLPRSGTGSGELPRSGLVRVFTRYAHLTVVFLISGIYHWWISIAQGLGWRESGAVSFFLLMAVGIMIEDAVQWVWSGVRGGKLTDEGKTARKGKWWTTAIGYLWVVFWFSVATPYYAYPSLSRNKGEEKDKLLPFSVVGYLV